MTYRFIFSLMILYMLVVMSGCRHDFSFDMEKQEEDLSEPISGFDMELVGEDAGFAYYRETTTDVMYLWARAGYAGGFTSMSDPETGLPLTYKRYMEMADAIRIDGGNESFYG